MTDETTELEKMTILTKAFVDGSITFEQLAVEKIQSLARLGIAEGSNEFIREMSKYPYVHYLRTLTDSEPELTPLESFQHVFREFTGLCTVNANHLNGRELALAKTKMEEAGMWFERALELHHKPIPVANNAIVVPVTDSATDKGAI